MLSSKSILLTFFSFLTPFFTFAQEAAEKGLDQKIDDAFRPVADFVGSIVFYAINIGGKSVPIVLIVLICGALFFTLYFKFANFTLIKTAVKVVKGDYDELDHHTADVSEGDPTPGGDVFETIGT